MFSLALLNRVRIGVVFGLIAASLPAQARASQLDVVSITPTAADRSIQHDIGGVTMQFEERSIDLALLAELSDADQVRRSPHGTLAPAGSEPAMLFSPVYQVPIEKPEPWLDVVVLWKISSGDAHSIAIELQGSVDGVDWAEWQSIRCMCCGVREVEENVIVSQLNTMDAATRYVRFRVLWPEDGQAVELEWVKLHFISPGASPPELLEPQRAPLADIGTLAAELCKFYAPDRTSHRHAEQRERLGRPCSIHLESTRHLSRLGRYWLSFPDCRQRNDLSRPGRIAGRRSGGCTRGRT